MLEERPQRSPQFPLGQSPTDQELSGYSDVKVRLSRVREGIRKFAVSKQMPEHVAEFMANEMVKEIIAVAQADTVQ